MKKMGYQKTSILCILAIFICLVIGGIYDVLGAQLATKKIKTESTTKTARIVANGDILIHDILYMSARQDDGTYDFNPYFEYVKPWIKKADLAIGDYEGTISDEVPLAGYPLFNAPSSIATAMKNTGYDVADIAHNHILDSYLSGALNTVNVFKSVGIDTIGVYTKDRAKQPFLIKNVNGIKIAILGYSYGYNGMEATLTQSEFEKHMSDLDEAKIKADLKKAEKLADVTVVMPQMGEEYRLEPTNEQIKLYHKMVDWGADVVFGGHPHVIEPSEIIKKDGEKKFIIYSMGNFISNQRLETVDDIWTERGLLMDVTFEKNGDKTTIKAVKAHPTIVWAPESGKVSTEGFGTYDYRVFVMEDVIKGGKYRHLLDDSMKERVDTAYKETNELVNLEWK